MRVAILIGLLPFLPGVRAVCPNQCSGHGTCNGYDQCTCFLESAINTTEFGGVGTIQAEWTGADCSLRTCPRGTSWTSVKTDSGDPEDEACFHKTEVECSDMGVCDRATGLCKCFPGYGGDACRRTLCPNECSGHGTCRSNLDFAYDFAVAKTLQLMGEGYNEEDATERFQQNYVVSYDDAWDSGMHYGCKCDIGYRGIDCAQIECPSSNDPLDDKCEDDVIQYRMQIDSAVGATGWVQAYQIGEGNEFEADGSGSSGKNPNYNLPDYGAKQKSGVVYACAGAMSSQDCSGRGLCNYNTGVCECFAGYAGTSCKEMEELV